MVVVWIFNWQSHSDREITQLTMQPLTMNLIQLIKKSAHTDLSAHAHMHMGGQRYHFCVRFHLKDISPPSIVRFHSSNVRIMPEIIRHQHRIGYWAKGKAEKRQFVSLTNFGVKLLKHVEAPASLREESGFVVEVTQKLKGATTVRSGYVLHTVYVSISHS